MARAADAEVERPRRSHGAGFFRNRPIPLSLSWREATSTSWLREVTVVAPAETLDFRGHAIMLEATEEILAKKLFFSGGAAQTAGRVRPRCSARDFSVMRRTRDRRRRAETRPSADATA